MANPGRKSSTSLVLLIISGVLLTCSPVRGQLTPGFYASSCPNLESTVKSAVSSALGSDPRIGASLLRLHFHDCFVDGCDGSVLLDDTSTIAGEKNVFPNVGSLRGFEVVDSIKSSVEAICPGVVSCADILALAALAGVLAAGGPYWNVELGRCDSFTAVGSHVAAHIPLRTEDVSALTNKFSSVGLDQTDLVALSGAHTFGKAQCGAFSDRLYNFQGTGSADPSIDPSFLHVLQAECPNNGDATVVQDLDQSTPSNFDNAYYSNLLLHKGILNSDQVLETSSGTTADLVSSFGADQSKFFSQFINSMLKMGRNSPKTGSDGEIRTNCRFVNSA